MTLGDLEVYGARCGYVVEGSGYIAELIVSRQLGSAIEGGRWAGIQLPVLGKAVAHNIELESMKTPFEK